MSAYGVWLRRIAQHVDDAEKSTKGLLQARLDRVQAELDRRTKECERLTAELQRLLQKLQNQP